MKVFIIKFKNLELDEEDFFTVHGVRQQYLKQKIGDILVSENELLKSIHLVDLETETIHEYHPEIVGGKIDIVGKVINPFLES